MKDENKKQSSNAVNKDVLSQVDLKNDIKTFKKSEETHAALETPEGKNNGAEPAAYRNQQKART